MSAASKKNEICFTDEQLNAINARGNVLVSAAAGSGKTAVLVERVIRRIIDDDVPADRFVISTFTKDAASEMKMRIADRISEEISLDPTNSRYIQQSFLLTKAKISTIDSFCGALVRDYFYKLDLEPDFKIMSDQDLRDLTENVLNEIINERLESSPDTIKQLLGNFQRQFAVSQLKGAISDIYSYLITLPHYERVLRKYAKMYDEFDIKNSVWIKMLYGDVKARLSLVLREYRESKESIEQSPFYDDYKARIVGRFEPLCRLYKAVCENDYSAAYKAVREYSGGTISLTCKKDIKPYARILKELASLADTAFNAVQKYFLYDEDEIVRQIKWIAPSMDELFLLVGNFIARLSEKKREINQFDFADIEQFALSLLVDENDAPTDIARELSDYYYEVMVDEFQDTNDLQCAIFNAVSDGGKKLFTVGDVKQSIYEFRRANPKIFLKRKNSLPLYDKNNNDRQDCKVIMSGNFRSERNICNFVNYLFSRIMSERAGQMTYEREDELCANIDCDFGGRANVRLDIVQKGKTDDGCCRIVQIIDNLVKNEKIYENGILRPVKYGDIVVLYRKNSQISRLSEKLKKSGIPCTSKSKSSFYSTREISLAYYLLSVVDNPKNDFAMLCVLSSSLFGFSADDLAKLKNADKSKTLYSLLLMAAKTDLRAKEFIDKLKKYRRYAVQLGLSELLLKIFDDTGLIDICTVYGGKAAKANLRKLVSTAVNFEQSHTFGLSGFVRFLTRVRAQKDVSGEGVVGEENAVKIMTVHGSKGLQFPICIIGELESDFMKKNTYDFEKNEVAAPILLTSECGFGLKAVDTEKNVIFPMLPYAACTLESELNTRSENIRLLYVALTRAQQMLIMCGCVNSVKKTVIRSDDEIADFAANSSKMINILMTACANHPDCDNLRRVIGGEAAENSYEGRTLGVSIINADDIEYIVPNAEENDAKPDKTQIVGLQERLNYTYPYKKINKVAAKQSASRLAHKNENADYSCSAVPLFLTDNKLTAAQKGTAMHKLMQYLDVSGARADFQKELERIRAARYLTDLELESVDTEKVKKFVSSPLGERMANADSIYHEREFMAELPATQIDTSLDSEFSDEKIVIQGAVDCVFFEGGKMVIVDYKTDRVMSVAELAEKYAVQLKVYKMALSQIFGSPETELIIYSFYLGEQIEIE